MILIAVGGSTKADWIALDSNKKEHFRVRTLGLNPAVISSEELTNRIINMFQLINIKDEVTEVYFYGAGCSSPELNEIVEKGLAQIFPAASILVEHDLLACAYATYQGAPAISCIVGTGSNSCFFDGQNLLEEVPALGYILGDEGSGSYFGKQLLSSFLQRATDL